jgi:hypothetical protein
MMNLPEDFIRETRQLMGEERFNRYLGAFEEEAPVSIRLNVTGGRFFCNIAGDVTKEPSPCYIQVDAHWRFLFASSKIAIEALFAHQLPCLADEILW